MTEAVHIRVADPEEVEPDPRTGAIERLMREIRAGHNTPHGRAAADRLHFALHSLATSAPTEETRARLQQILDDGTVDDFVDSWDVPCRAAVISAQLALGYPWALEVSPEDLEWLRTATAQRDGRITRARWWTVGVALPSLAWNGLCGFVAAHESGWMAAPFAVGAAHAVGALVTSFQADFAKTREQRRTAARQYKALGLMWWCGPVFSGIAAVAVGAGWPVVGIMGMIFALPAMVTAWCSAVAGKRLVPEKSESE